jgi:hypothetical protein
MPFGSQASSPLGHRRWFCCLARPTPSLSRGQGRKKRLSSQTPRCLPSCPVVQTRGMALWRRQSATVSKQIGFSTRLATVAGARASCARVRGLLFTPSSLDRPRTILWRHMLDASDWAKTYTDTWVSVFVCVYWNGRAVVLDARNRFWHPRSHCAGLGASLCVAIHALHQRREQAVVRRTRMWSSDREARLPLRLV